MQGAYDLDTRLFTPIFWRVRACTSRFVINFGSAGSSKSWSQAQHEVIRALEEPQRIAICRKHANWINKSVWQLVRNEILIEWGIPFTENRTEKTIDLPNGSQLLFIGLDDPEKVKSLENVERVWIEEATQLDEADMDQINLRVRGTERGQISLTFNPVSKHHWIKAKFFGAWDFESPREDTEVIHSTYQENPHIDEAYHAQMDHYREVDPEYFEVYGLGHWGEPRTGYEFYKAFTGKEIRQLEYDPDLPLHVSFDFNYLPYMTVCIFQVDVEAAVIRQVDEICATDPHNNTPDAARLFARRYAEHRRKVFLYGDPSGKAQGTRTQGPANDFSLIKNVWREFGFQVVDMVLKAPPDVSDRGDFANALFRAEVGYRFFVDESCSRSIEDFKNVKGRLDGTKEKAKQKDQRTGLQMEMRGHTSDAFDYFICSALRDAYNEFVYGPQTGRRTGKRKKASKNRF